jgi:hypothetical protein
MRICAATNCDRFIQARGFCAGHYRRMLRNGTPGTTGVGVPRGVRVGPENASWVGGTYEAAHKRVEAARGRADVHQCARCGADAHEWAYNHQDPTEGHHPWPYSLDPSFYDPMCRSCHRRMDHGRRKAERGAARLAAA